MEMIWKITWDHALRRVVVGMRESFPKEAVLGRSGGEHLDTASCTAGAGK
ncbi:hypothetical protein ACTQ32_06115 [Roseburia faecis]|nr:hypothetical protein [Lachnospiraceae bacterium]